MTNIRLAASLKTIIVAGMALGALAQTAAAPSFEVASIKLSPTKAGSIFSFPPGGRFSAEIWVKYLIQAAYGVEDYQVEGGPGWMASQWYFVEARAGNPSATREEILLMLRTLLAERFKLKIRKEVRQVSVFELVVAKDGPKLRTLKQGEPSKCGRDNSFVCGITAVSRLAALLRGFAGRPILDKTGIEGRYDVLLDFDVYSASGKTPPPGFDKPSLSTALQEQLGLKLQDAKAAMPIYVIDSIERPTEN